ncbi:hypothetical protein HWQ46_20170 [Shewanella sp. D64]|uniref:hypothetical protein n=1 Tax=unclassified Shewanella TaxID=196818 RepID=UPI0022BA1A6A|nr:MULTISPECIES: hypothetical protein [unclassified Shewanella]MEC4727856.1 hypothetical protein [Shewanella sp. D64]MEC4739898.1 hypothetical protein [Shewanella sp. E94]WBJ97136.1 hypothetical protein HWQ47_08540 [Shewanella sp. MTB7]
MGKKHLISSLGVRVGVIFYQLIINNSIVVIDLFFIGFLSFLVSYILLFIKDLLTGKS